MEVGGPMYRVLIATVSTSRYDKLMEGGKIEDVSGDLAEKLFRKAGYREVKRVLIRDDPDMIRRTVDMARRESYNILVFIGGTGVAKDDYTYETLRRMFEKEITGFNTLYILYSEKEIGVRAMASRATAGFVKGVLVYAIPGSPKAVELCIERLILPEADHLIKVYRGHKH